MIHAIRAIFEQGKLRLLDPVELSEGQEIQVLILSEQNQVRAALSDLLVDMPEFADNDVDEAALMAEIADGFRGQNPLSQTIIEERQEGP